MRWSFSTLTPIRWVSGLRGKTADEARSFLGSQPGLGGDPRIEISPSWAPRAYRIELAVAAPK